MRRLYLFLVLLLLNGVSVSAQDEITFRTGDIQQAKVLEINADEIIYKKFENLSGPSYSVKKDKVFMVKYENGTRDVFGADKPLPEANPETGAIPGVHATIFFYRPAKIMGSRPDITVGTFVPDEVIVSLQNGRWYKSDYPHSGQMEFVTGIYSINDKKLKVNIEPGKTYYMRCSIIQDFGLQSQLEIVDEETGKGEMQSLKEQMKAK